MTTASNKTVGLETAIARAVEALATVDLPARCAALQLPAPVNNTLTLTMLGRTMQFRLPDFSGVLLDADRPVHPADQLILLHYLQHDLPVHLANEWITFRQFQGGDFYWQPFRVRTAEPLLRAIGNDLDTLKKRLDRFEWSPLPRGDLGARIEVLGPIEVGLVYHLGDEEFPAEVDILFDQALRHTFCAEDAAAIASRVCLALSNQQCDPCSGCALCDKT